MPTYEYACPTCGIVECFQSIKDAPLARCPECKKAKVSRIFSGGGGVIFKGSGFWETDYNRSSDYKKRSSEAAGAGKGDAAKTTTSTAHSGAATAAADPGSSTAKTTKPSATGKPTSGSKS